MEVRDLHKKELKEGQIVKIKAFIKFNRGNSKIRFLIMNDGSCFDNIQVVVKKDFIDNFSEVELMKINSCIEITGRFIKTPLKDQSFEIDATKIKMLAECASNYPLQKKNQSMEFLRDNAHIRFRTNIFSAIFRIRSSVIIAIHSFFNERNFINFTAPIITSNDSEGGGESFGVTTRFDDKFEKDFFSKKASLTVSGQLHAEAFAQQFMKVYSFGPTFRAEKSNTTKHISEFWMLEPEVSFCDLDSIMELGEDLLSYIANWVLKNNTSEINYLDEVNKDGSKASDRIRMIIKNDKLGFPKVTYTESLEKLNEAKKNGYKFESNNFSFGVDLQTEHERYLCEIIYKSPLWIIDYPKKIKAFYMKETCTGDKVKACDLLVPGIGELIGGSQREENYERLSDNCKNLNIDIKDLEWYLDLRKYGYYMSSGFGLGFERLIMYLTNTKNIRDTIPFPRFPKQLNF